MKADDNKAQPTTLPVFFLIDVSSSMFGMKIDSVNNAVWEMIQKLSEQIFPGVKIQFSAITFGDKALLHMPPCSVFDMKWRPAMANGVTAMGAAFRMVKRMIEDKETTPLKSYRPTVILITDGAPTDIWDPFMYDLTRTGRAGKTDRMALAIGVHADQNVLKRFLEGTNHEVALAKNSNEVHRFFRHAAKSIITRIRSSNPNLVPDDTSILIDDNEMPVSDYGYESYDS